MAFVIKSELNLEGVEEGQFKPIVNAYVLYNVHIPHAGTYFYSDIQIYESQLSFLAGLTSIRVVEIPSMFLKKELTQEEFKNLSITGIENYVKEHLAQYVPEENINKI